MCRRIAWSWSISEGVSIDVLSNTGGMVEALLKLEYRLIKGLCLLEIAIDRPGACSSNTLLVCVIGLLLSSAAAVDLFVVQKYELVPSTVFPSCCPYNQIRKERKSRVICMQSVFCIVSCNANRESQCQVDAILAPLSLTPVFSSLLFLVFSLYPSSSLLLVAPIIK